MAVFDQVEFDIRCEWGQRGVEILAPISDVVIIVDVLSFCTSIDIAASRNAVIFPYRWRDESVHQFARKVNAEVADHSNPHGVKLSPSSLENLPENYRVVMPSPNGSALTLATNGKPTIAGCLRNSKAVAAAAMRIGRKIAVIPCGERWYEDNSLRPSVEDLLGAGSIISELRGVKSPEAESAMSIFQYYEDCLFETIKECASGKEKLSKNMDRDVELAAAHNVSGRAPILKDGAYQKIELRENVA